LVSITIEKGVLLYVWLGHIHLVIPPVDITIPIPGVDLLAWLIENLWDAFMSVMDKMAEEWYAAQEKE